MASTGGLVSAAGDAAYYAAKTGLVDATRALAAGSAGSSVPCSRYVRASRGPVFNTPARMPALTEPLVPEFCWGSPEEVVTASLHQMGRGVVVIPRWRDCVLIVGLRAGLVHPPPAAHLAACVAP